MRYHKSATTDLLRRGPSKLAMMVVFWSFGVRMLEQNIRKM